LLKVPWTLTDCVWASVPAALLFGFSAVRRAMGLPTLLGAAAGPWRITALILFTAAVWVVPVYVIAIRRRGARAADLGFRRAPWGESATLAGAAFLFYFGSSMLWQMVALHFRIPLQPDLLKKFPDGRLGLALALVLGAMVAPIAEETFFRGFLFAALRNHYRFWIAAGVSALIFAAGHMVPGAILPLFLLGFLFAWLRERTGSIWPSIALHMLNNALYFGLRFFLQTK
jgi:membrane protease YdiL (CAAX protease family)